jgi:hypothetical protein
MTGLACRTLLSPSTGRLSTAVTSCASQRDLIVILPRMLPLERGMALAQLPRQSSAL